MNQKFTHWSAGPRVRGSACVFALAAGLLLSALPAASGGKPARAKAAALRAAQERQRIPRQETRQTASVQGVVRNELGRGIPDVAVSIRGASGRAQEASTNGEGIFRFREVAPGTYRVQLLKPGYETAERSGVNLKVGEDAVWEFTLKSMEPLESSSVTCGPSAGLPRCPEPGAAAAEPQEPYRELRRRTDEEVAAMAAAPSLPDESEVFETVPNRWKIPYPEYKRYAGKGDFVYVKGHWWDPFNVNRLKGDKPIIGNKTFFAFTGLSETVSNFVRVPLPSPPGAQRPGSQEFFGKGELFFLSQTFRLSFELFHGSTQAFRPVDWRIKVTPAFNMNYLNVKERGIVNIDVTRGTNRFDTRSASLQEAFVEFKVKDLSPNFDVLFVRAGIQQFTSDFRGFIFVEEQPGLRIFGNLHGNKWEYNLAYFWFLEKDTNSGLNLLKEQRHQQVLIGNIYFQDFLGVLGYTTQFSVHLNKEDSGEFFFDKNGFLARPNPIGAVHSQGELQLNAIRTVYLGWTGFGHFGRINVNHAFYHVGGEDTRNPLAGRPITVNAQMAAAELSIDKDWLRFRGSFFYASGDSRPRDGRGRGFDSIVDNPSFIGGPFSFWNREAIRLTGSGVALTSGLSLLPSLRAANLKELSHSNHVNPGIFIYNAGMDIEWTPKLRSIINVNYIRFHRTEPLELILFQAPIRHSVGVDSSIGFQWRPPLSDNIVILFGVSSLQPGQGFRDIYTGKTLWSIFTNVRFLF
jgi:hypothetical protein